MADRDRLARLSPEQRTRLQERLLSRAAAKMRAAAKAAPTESPTEGTLEPRDPGEPIAIVGMACRFGGAPDLASYWRMIRDGLEGVVEVPKSRWNVDDFYDPAGGPGKSRTRRGAFLDGIDQFEPTFFGVTPREASRMDPQQRMLLEVAWETFENAGCPADRMAGTATGVYVGIGGTDYKQAPIHSPDYFQIIDAHVGTGNALSIASNRVSYVFDLRGPSLSVDTACSSSSLAIHLAVESLRRGECTAALAGGVNAILTPEVTIAFSQAHMLSPEGQCRSYDSGSSGYVRGEGCAFVLLKRLEDAQRDGDDIVGVLLGSAVNQDGRTPGISAPSVVQQQACLRSAQADAGVTPDDFDYIEGHGTGTPLGDPIELQALAHVFRRKADEAPPLRLASVKANIGHTETVSGVAGLIKTLLLMQHGWIAPQLNFEKLNPHAELGASRVELTTEPQPWPSKLAEGGRRRIAGVSSFGFGGTNTHMVVAEPPLPGKVDDRFGQVATHVIKLAAKTPDRIPAQARQLADWLRSDDGRGASLADVAYTANTGRVNFPHRTTVVESDTTALINRLDRIAEGSAAEDSQVVRTAPRTAWMFTGQGAQRVGMGRELYRTEPVFRSIFDRCDEILADQLPDRLIDVVHATDENNPRINETRYTQPALFALECGLAALWRSWGVEPDVVLGHSIGEYAAAVTAGVLTLADGARLVAERARLMHDVPGDGGMAVVFADEATVTSAIASRTDRLAIAAVNGPNNVVLSGDVVELGATLAELAARDIEAKRLTVSHAFHSPLMDPILDEFEAFARTIDHQKPRVAIASNVTGQLIAAGAEPEDWARYWRDHLRNAVRFADGVATIARARVTHWIEVGPAPVLAGMAARCDFDSKASAKWIPSLRPRVDEGRTLAEAVAAHWAGGGTIDWRARHQGHTRQRLPLPNYPMLRERFWYENVGTDSSGSRIARAYSDASPVLGARLPIAADADVFEAPLDEKTPAWLVDHQVQGSVVAPGAMFVEQSLAAAAELTGAETTFLQVEGLTIRQALVPPMDGRLRLQTVVERSAGGRRRLAIHSAPAGEAQAKWTHHAEATLVETPTKTLDALADREGFDTRVIDEQSRTDFYQSIAERGLVYGQAFRVLDGVRRSDYDAVAPIVPSKNVAAELDRYRLHPSLGDGLLQTVAATLPLEADGSYSPHTYVPVRIESIRLHRPIKADEELTAYAIRRLPTPETDESSPEYVEADAFLLDAAGLPIASFQGVRVQRLATSAAGEAATKRPTDWLYEIAWQEAELSADAAADLTAGPTLIFADESGVGDALVEQVEAAGGTCVVVRSGDAFAAQVDERASTPRTSVTIDPADESHYDRLVGLLAANPSGTPAAIIHLGSLTTESAGTDWEASQRSGVGSAMRLVQQLARRSLVPKQGVVLATRGAQSVGLEAESASPTQAATVGLGRVAAMEHPELGVRLVDLDSVTPEATAATAAAKTLFAELLANDRNENQIAYRASVRYIARLAKAAAVAERVDAARGEGTPTPDVPTWRLALKRAGSFDGLEYEATERIAPEPDQVQIEVHATGLNFSDVLKALGLYPGIRDAVVPLGIESSGVVTAVGDKVEHLKVGDAAMGVLPYAFASHATTAAYAMVPKPAGISHEEAATIPIVFLTAHHALVRLAQIERGERVLIHAAAGGVGLAALQIAQHLGAEVFATAGSDEKRDLLRSLGVQHVMDSRSLDFVQEVREATDGEGVDVVLNSLPGEAIDASLGLLRAYGRFCEIGKIDIYQDRKLGLLPFQDNLSYFAIDLDRLLRERPEQVRRLFADVMQCFADGVYRPLAYTGFAAEQTPDAFRYMSLRKNIGKVVVSMVAEEASTADTGPVLRGGGYLVTGGLGALGRRVAKWLVERGAGGVALLSRRDPDDSGQAFLAELIEAGAVATCLRGDVGDRSSLDAALGNLSQDFPKMAGLIHAAGVLDDGLLTALDAQRLDRVMRPKAVGAWNLHEATLDAASPLSSVTQFVMFSSVAAMLGSPGQANYAAANAALDALARHRHTKGLPALSLGWGPWGSDGGTGTGMAAGETADAVRSKGMDLLPPDAALELMGDLIAAEAVSVGVFDARWDTMSRLMSGRRPALLENQLVEADTPAGRGDNGLRQRLLTATPESRQTELVEMVRNELARVTSVAAEDIDPAAPLSTIGIDSLMALELKNNLESKLAITLPMGKLLAGPSVVTLAEAAAEELVGEAPTRADEKWSPLVTLREGPKDAVPVFLMPLLGGDASAYGELAKAFDTDSTVIALRPRGLDTDEPPHERRDEMARDYAEAIRGRQANGPYHLAGWSTGGITALAVAEVLESAGETVAVVGMFDTPPTSVYDDVDTNDDAAFLVSVLDFAARFKGLPPTGLSKEQIAKLPEAERFATVLKKAHAAGLAPKEVDESYVRRLVSVGEALVVASREGELALPKASVAFFAPTDDSAFSDVAAHDGSNVDAWREALGDRLEEHPAPGDHFTMMSGDGAAAIAAVLGATQPVASR